MTTIGAMYYRMCYVLPQVLLQMVTCSFIRLNVSFNVFFLHVQPEMSVHMCLCSQVSLYLYNHANCRYVYCKRCKNCTYRGASGLATVISRIVELVEVLGILVVIEQVVMFKSLREKTRLTFLQKIRLWTV